MQAVMLVLLLGVSLCEVRGNEEDRSNPDTVSIIRAIKSLQTKVQTLEDSLVQLQNSPRVAFFAGFKNDNTQGTYGPVLKDMTIKYKRVLTNIGNGYNSDTGLFTAPVGGVYVFHFTMHSNWRLSGFVAVLKKNTEVLVGIFDQVSDNIPRDSGSSVSVVTLEQGDTVYVELQSLSSFFDDEGRYTTFSGFLLSPTSPSSQ